ncbi:uncharacterized protein LOC126209930 [Schistocerca nitens]|uniref:uncharacterized protein LOC126209930 n=1 Tax=Schistocerca nitens TaxID=7011 RepID=UPI0021196650|nr:uncharacterized protein LOC126209930 [Schistocerca nitens]
MAIAAIDCPCCNLPEWLEIFERFLHSVSKSKLLCDQATPNLCWSVNSNGSTCGMKCADQPIFSTEQARSHTSRMYCRGLGGSQCKRDTKILPESRGPNFREVRYTHV